MITEKELEALGWRKGKTCYETGKVIQGYKLLKLMTIKDDVYTISSLTYTPSGFTSGPRVRFEGKIETAEELRNVMVKIGVSNKPADNCTPLEYAE